MIKKLHLAASLLVISAASFAQQMDSEMAPFPTNSSLPQERALWTIQLDSDPKPVALGLAGACWTGTEFWVSKWGNDSLFTLNASGAMTTAFTIPGITGVRGITTDGIFLYMGANGTAIYKVNPVTKTLSSTITTSVTNCRYVAYDPTLNAGAGGFWTGSYASNITAVSMTGTTLSTILAATHGLGGIYGLAYDPYSTGGPYLWAFDQDVAGATLVQLDMTGLGTGLTHDANSDLQSGAGVGSGLAGGLFITNSFVAGKKSIGGIDQGISLFAYELSDPTGIHDLLGNAFEMNVFPNPSAEATSVRFKLTSNEAVTVEIYNILGSLVSTVVTENMTAGSHLIKMDNSNLMNGTYFVKLTAGNVSATSKFTVIK